MLTGNPLWLDRTRGLGVISAADALDYGMTGPCLRGSGAAALPGKSSAQKANPSAGSRN